jgi:ATP-dependent RNA helicase RhlE
LPFVDLNLSSGLLRAVAELGFSEPFPIQTQAIPLILSGRDLCARAKTGSGKTLAYALPILEMLGGSDSRRGSSISALVLVPTRELADQVGEAFVDLVRGSRHPCIVRVAHGGTSINTQMLALRGGADVLVATPGRLIDLASKNAVRLGALRFLVLDEADKMLDLGFSEELSAVLALLPERRQSLLFSATLSGRLEDVEAACLRDPARVAVDGIGGQASLAHDASALGIVELVYEVEPEGKGPLLRRIIADGAYSRVLVFASSTHRADNVSRKLNNNGIVAAPFHGGLSQGARTETLADFRSGGIRVLVASDLASRGLDIEGLPCVVNYELPRSPLDYVHRVGRTGRAGESGLAITLVSPDEEAMIRVIEKKIGRKLPRAPVE